VDAAAAAVLLRREGEGCVNVIASSWGGGPQVRTSLGSLPASKPPGKTPIKFVLCAYCKIGSCHFSLIGGFANYFSSLTPRYSDPPWGGSLVSLEMAPLGDCRVEMGVSATLTPRLDLTNYKLKDECSREVFIILFITYCCEFLLLEIAISPAGGVIFLVPHLSIVLTNGYPYPGFYLFWLCIAFLPFYQEVSVPVIVPGDVASRNPPFQSVESVAAASRWFQPSVAVRYSSRIAG